MPKTHKVAIVAVAVVTALAGLANPIPDIAYMGLRLGEHIVRRHSLAPADYLSYLPISSGWWDTSWLWNAISCVLFSVGGEFALRALAALASTLLAILIYKISSAQEPVDVVAVSFVPAFMVLRDSLSFRPMIASLVFFAAQMLFLERRSARAWKFTLLYLAWAQVDHAFVAGLTYLISYLFMEKSVPRGRKIAWALAAIIGSAPSPNMWQFARHFSSIVIIFEPTEDFHVFFNMLQALAVFSGLACAAYMRERSGRAVALLVLAVLGLIAGEYFPLSALAAIPIITALEKSLTAGALQPVLKAGRRAILLYVAIGVLIVALAPHRRMDADDKIIIFLKSHPMFGQIFAPWQIGGRVGYITGKKIVIDGEHIFYNWGAFDVYKRLNSAEDPEWDGLTLRYGIGGIIVPTSAFYYRILGSKPEWALVFDSGEYLFFVRDGGLNSTLLDRWGRLNAREVEKGSPEFALNRLKEKAKEWEKKGNPYEARWYLITLLASDPNDREAQQLLARVERQITEAGRKR